VWSRSSKIALGYIYLGHRKHCGGNSNMEEALLTDWLKWQSTPIRDWTGLWRAP